MPRRSRASRRLLAGPTASTPGSWRSPNAISCRRSGCPPPGIRAHRERARFRLHLVRHRTALKNRIHATLIAFGHPCPVSDLFGTAGRELLGRLEIPEPWAGTVAASLELIEDLDARIDGPEAELRRLGADHPYVPRLMTVPGIAWVLGFTIASEIGHIARFSSPKKLTGYTGLCPRVHQSVGKDHQGPLSKNVRSTCDGR